MARRIVGLGLAVVDHLYRVTSLDLVETRTRFSERRVSSGGMVCNAAVQAATLGCRTDLLSALGDDSDGRFLVRTLRQAGVGTRGVIRSADLTTTVALVLVEAATGRRRFIVPDRRALEAQAPDFDLARIRRGSILLVDGHFPRQALRAVKRAREIGVPVIADFSRPRRSDRALLPFVDFPVVPEEFAQAYGEGDARRAIDRLRQRFGGVPVVTQGARGGLYWDAGRVRRFAARRVAVRDTTGAGDAFHGAFAAGLCHGMDVPAAIDLAARAAARCCTALGGTTRLLRADEVPGLRGSAQSIS